MLLFTSISCQKDRLERFEKFNHKTETWLISDLTSKFEVQKKLLQNKPLLPENTVLRASELWQKLLIKLRPELQMTSLDYVRSLVLKSLSEKKIPWAQSPGVVKTVLASLQQLLPIFIHPDGLQIVKSWFQDNPSSYVAWGHWFELSREIWDELQLLNICLPQWAPVYIAQSDLHAELWNRKLVVDLGCDLTLLEADVLKSLSQAGFEIEVLVPEADWVQAYSNTLWSYNLLKDESVSYAETASQFQVETLSHHNIHWLRFSSTLGEVKQVVAQVRSMIEQGIEPAKIAVLAPDIEQYWPSLSSFFAVEGILANKSKVVRMASFHEVSQWVSRLRVESGRVRNSDIEMDAYSDQQELVLDYDTFKRLYNKVFDVEDLSRSFKIKKLYKQKINLNDYMYFDEFISLSLKFWREHWPTERLEALLHKLYAEAQFNVTLSFDQWFMYLQNQIAKIEILVAEANVNGISCDNLSSGHWLACEKVFIIGLNEANMNQQTQQVLNSREVISISQNTGFQLTHPEAKKNEFDFLWNVQVPDKEFFVSCAASDWSGQVQAPSKLWLVGAMQSKTDLEKVMVPETTRWDELQKNAAADFVERDLNSQVQLNVLPPQAPSISVSRVENYISCPYKFMAEKLLMLSDLPDLDLDIDHMTKGKLMHALFCELTVEPFQASWQVDELDALIETCRKQEGVQLADERTWPIIKKQYVELAQRFIEFESQWRKEFVSTQTVGRELKIETYWDTDNANFSDTGDIKFKGFIDRVDSDADSRYVVIDYKSSAGQISNHNKWLEDHKLQLPLYALSVQEGKTSLPAAEVVASQYYVAKNFDRKKGYVLKSAEAGLLPAASRFNGVTAESKQTLMDAVKQDFNNAVKDIIKGEFEPNPEELKICQQCSWRKMCRAKHFNR